VHDPGVTMLQVLAYALSAVAVAGGVALVRRWRRSQDSQLPTS
jgi:hypothetical protein